MEGIVLVLVIVGALFSVVWLVFPFVVSSSLSRVGKPLKKQNEILVSVADRQNETNRALQFLVNREKR
jgi:hypothetical protein